ncbi:MAG: DUF4157 domain-containing protein [Methanosarcinaceae archaeon]|nr:DUF4157 domain-containing protein [Methanosarcinaceae archaeon]
MPEHEQAPRSKKTSSNIQREADTSKQRDQTHPAAITQKAQFDPGSLTPADILQLQRTVGNQAVGKLLKSGQVVQAKLTVQPIGDKYEQEADRVAKQVVERIPAPGQQGVQRQAVPEEEEELLQGKFEENIQKQELEEEELLQGKFEENIQRQEQEEEEEIQMMPAEGIQCLSGGSEIAATPKVESAIQQVRGGGQSLSNDIRAPMEQAFGADFSRVRVHIDAGADVLNHALQAKAFTTGQDILFKRGAYEPDTDSGRELLAHELTHVVQQSKLGRRLQKKKLSDYAIAKAAMGVVRFDAPAFGHIENPKWLESAAIRRIKWELTTKEKEGGWDKEDVEAIAAWVIDYAKRFREFTNLYKVVGMLAEAAGEKGKKYSEQIRNIKWHPRTPEAGPPTIVFGSAPSRGFYDLQSHSIQVDLFKHETALEVLDTILFECINTARTAELEKAIEGIEEYGTDVVYIDKLRQIYDCGTTAELCKTLGLSAYMTKTDEQNCMDQGFVPLPSRAEVSSQAARQALWHWKTEGWSEKNRKQLWGASAHAPGMKATVKV